MGGDHLTALAGAGPAQLSVPGPFGMGALGMVIAVQGVTLGPGGALTLTNPDYVLVSP